MEHRDDLVKILLDGLPSVELAETGWAESR